MLDLNITILFQMVNFFIVLYVLNILLIRPIRAILQERKDKMDDMSGEAEAFEREAKERLSAYQAELTRARQEAGLTRETARNEALAEQQRVVHTASQKAQAFLAEAQASIKVEAEATLAELQKQVKQLAGKLATRVMG